MWGLIFLILLLALFVALLPAWPYSRPWGYAPAGGAVALLVIFLFLVWFGILSVSWPWVYY